MNFRKKHIQINKHINTYKIPDKIRKTIYINSDIHRFKYI